MAETPKIDQDLIRQLAALLHETELSEIEVEQDDLRIRVARAVTVAAPTIYAPAGAAPASPGGPEARERPVDPASHPGAVTSPMVGTCYLAAEPGARPFVEVGDTVKKDQTLLIIEAMKHMNPIVAPRDGRVTAILVEDARPVEFGEPLLILE